MLKRDMMFTFGGQIGRVTIGLLSTALMARALGPEGRGLYGLALLLPMTLVMILEPGMMGVNSTFGGLYKQHRPSLFIQTILFAIIASALGILAMWSYCFWLPIPRAKFGEIPTPILMMGVLLIPLQMLTDLLRELTRGAEMIAGAVVTDALGQTLRLAGVFVFVFLLHGGVPAAMWVTIGVPVLLMAIYVWQMRGFATLSLRHLSWPIIRHSFQFGSILNVSSIGIFLITQIGLYLLAYLDVSLIEIGYYTVAFTAAQQLQLIPTSVAQAFLPRASNDPETRLKQTPQVYRCTFIASAGLMLIMAVIGVPGLLLLFGVDFAGSIPSFLVMLPGIAIYGSSRVLGMYLWVRKKPQYGMINNWIALAATALIGLGLIKAWGILGAAVSYSIGVTLASALTALAYRKESKVPLKQLQPTVDDFRLLQAQIKPIIRRLLPFRRAARNAKQ